MDYPTKYLANNEKININSQEIYYFVNYYPKAKVEKFSDTDKRKNYSKLIWNLKNGNMESYPYFRSCILAHIENLGNEEWIVCSIPGHDQTSAKSNHMDLFLKKIFWPQNIHPVSGLIIRNKAMLEKHGTNYGSRTVEKDLDSYKIGNTRNIKGQNIIIFDDIVTSGCSLIAARRFLIKQGAKRVVLVALGKTVEDGYGRNLDWLF